MTLDPPNHQENTLFKHAYLYACVHMYTELVLDSLNLIQCTLHTKTRNAERGGQWSLSISVSLWEMTSNLEI